MHDCNLTISYKVDGKSYSTTENTSTRVPYKDGDSMTVYYDPKAPSDGATTSDGGSTILGVIFIIIGVIIPAACWVWWYAARKSKAVAAVGGVMTGLDVISGGRTGMVL